MLLFIFVYSKTMDKYKYYIGCSDYFGENIEPDRVFNENLVPYLESCGLNEDQIKEVKKMVSEIAEAAWINGSDSAECSLND